MKVTIDGKETACGITPDMSYEAAVDAIKQTVGEARIITAISVDGVSPNVVNEKTFFAKKAKDISAITVETDTPFAYAKRSIAGMTEFVGSFEKNVDEMIAFLQSGGEEDVYDTFSAGLTGLRNVFSFMTIAAEITKTDLATVQLGTKKGNVFLQDFSSSFDELTGALKDKDIVYIQDILRYELKPNLRVIKELLGELGKRLG